jgi:hypothetical protein
MPILSRFYGVIISMYYDEHPPPHFHVRYGSHQAKFAIQSGELIIGKLPRRARSLMEEWRREHVDELVANWELAGSQRPLRKIEPLR